MIIFFIVLLFFQNDKPLLWLQSPAAWSWTKHFISVSLPYQFLCIIHRHVTIYIKFLEQTVSQKLLVECLLKSCSPSIPCTSDIGIYIVNTVSNLIKIYWFCFMYLAISFCLMLSEDFNPLHVFLSSIIENPFLLPNERLNFILVKYEGQNMETSCFAYYLGYFIPSLRAVFDLASVIFLHYIWDVMKQNHLI